MEVAIYFSGVVFWALLAFFVRNRKIQVPIALMFVLWQLGFGIFLYSKINETWTPYFRNDALSVIFISILSVTAIFTIINSFIYFSHRNEKPLIRSIYLLALMLFFGCMTGVFLANNAGLLWILTEATTLAIAVLIYHERSIESLEATWKYVFVSTIGLSFSFVVY